MIAPSDSDPKPIFGRHEKFTFRHSWLRKGVEAVVDNPTVFSSDAALVQLGVGKNMVRSIRHWCQAVGLLEERGKVGRVQSFGASRLATKLLSHDKWDPYLEDVATMWLIHWQLVSNRERSLVWYLAFSTYLETEFTKQQLASFLKRYFDKANIRTTEGVIKREIDCFLRTYVTSWSKRGAVSEESLDCPLTELNLIRFLSDDGIYRFNVGPKPSLPAEIFGYGLLAYLATIASARRTVGIDECVYQPGSPGQAFKLDENSVILYLEAIEELTYGQIRIQEMAGLRQIYIHPIGETALDELADTLLSRFYD